jgi:two-component system response regulator HydG
LVNQLKILVIDDDGLMRDACKDTLARSGHDIDLAESGTKGLALLNRWAYDVVLLDLRMPEMDGMTVLRQIKEQDPETVVIVISGYGSVTSAVEAMKLGAFDFLPKPFTPADLRRAVDMASEKRRLILENFFLKEELKRKNAPGQVVTRSRSMRQILDLLDRLAPTDTTVLFTGESGTGKGLLAQAAA